MAQLTTQARPYARAAFEYANTHNAVAAWLNVLQTAAVLMLNTDVIEYVLNPKVSSETVLTLFVDVLENKVNASQKNFLMMLAEKKQLKLLPDIAALFTYYSEQQGDVVSVEVQSAMQLSAAQQQNLQKALEARLQKKVKLNCVLEAQLIGGAIIRTPEWVMDGSIKNKLQKLKTRLIG